MNPYSAIKNRNNLTNNSQGVLSELFLLASALEASYSSGFTGTVTPARYMIEALEASHGVHCPAVVRLRALFQGLGQLDA